MQPNWQLAMPGRRPRRPIKRSVKPWSGPRTRAARPLSSRRKAERDARYAARKVRKLERKKDPFGNLVAHKVASDLVELAHTLCNI